MGIESHPEELLETQDVEDPMQDTEHRGDGLSEDELPQENGTGTAPRTVDGPQNGMQTTLDQDELSFQEESDGEQHQSPQILLDQGDQTPGNRPHRVKTTLNEEEISFQEESEDDFRLDIPEGDEQGPHNDDDDGDGHCCC